MSKLFNFKQSPPGHPEKDLNTIHSHCCDFTC